MVLWAADAERGLIRIDGNDRRQVGPAGRLCASPGQVFCAGERDCCCYDAGGRLLFRFPGPPGVGGMTAGDGMIYLLSSDADSISAYASSDGSLLCAAPAGVYPQGLCVRPDGHRIAVAGGAAGEILLFDAQLRLLRSHRVPGMAVGVGFLPKGMAALCAVGDREISTLLLRISPWGVTEELFSCPEAPCCLHAAADGCAVGCHGAVHFLRSDGRTRRTLPCAFPGVIRQCQGVPLICDFSTGRVLLPNGRTLYRGEAVEDALLSEYNP
ncbi:MAG: hypothetical protein IJ189_04630 [Clostridia bacterium]|nr:hypothetical protein [Clostridia bacterium]